MATHLHSQCFPSGECANDKRKVAFGGRKTKTRESSFMKKEYGE